MPTKRRPSRKPSASTLQIRRLVTIMARLRAPGGCPWDRKQTHKSLLPYLIEETYELKDAILSGRKDRMVEELGDVLLQIVFHAELAREKHRFDLEDVARAVSDKLVRRHPHVFGKNRAELSAREVLARWERLKRAEGKSSRSILGGVPQTLPALLRAYRIQEKVAQFGFDWPDVAGVEKKLREETDEFHRARRSGNRAAQAEELGDLLFTLVNLARKLGVDPETALQSANSKFSKRFRRMEIELGKRKVDLGGSSLKTLEAAWQEAKKPRNRAAGGRTGNRARAIS